MKEKMMKKQPIAVGHRPLARQLTAKKGSVIARSEATKQSHSKGFTLIEMLVVLLIFSFIVGGILTVFINNQHTKRLAEAITEAQQSARLSSQILTTDLRNMGFGIDTENKQMFIVYASPYEIIFNGNIKPYPDDPDNPGYPKAMLSLSSAGPNYTAGMQYETGAETYRYTLDYNDDGTINSTDRSADAISNSTKNPNDYMLIRKIYGELSDGTNGPDSAQIALVRGPDQYPNQTDTTIYPLFTYWYDNDEDASTPPVLWGDTDNNGVLSATEIQNLQPISNTDILSLIKRVTVTITSETTYPDRRGNYHPVVVKTDVTPGNIAKPVRMIIGHVYNDANADSVQDAGETGISGWKVWLNAGDISVTDANGIYSFAVPAGQYTIFTQPKTGWKATTDVSKVVNTDTNDVHLETDPVFGFQSAATGWVKGYIYADSTGLACQYDPDSGDVPIANAMVLGDNFQDTTDANGYYCVEVNANDEHTIYVYTLSGVCIETIPSTGATYSPIPGDKDRMIFTVAQDDTAKINFYRVQATGTPCSTQVHIPNGGEIWAIGETKDIIYYADSKDSAENIDTVNIYLSEDAGGTWQYVGYKPAGFEADTDTFNWWIDTTYLPTTDALIQVVAHDEGGNRCYDESDNVFTITYSWGFPEVYFRRQWVNVDKDTINNIPGDTVHTDQDTNSIDSLIVKDTLYIARYLLPTAPTSDTSSSLAVATADTHLTGQAGGTRYFRYKHPPVYDTAYAQFITKKWVPYRESIPPDTWKFYLWGYISLTDPNNKQTLKTGSIRIHKLSKRDSLGRYASDTTLFYYDQPAGKYYAVDYDSSPPATIECSIIKSDTLKNTVEEDSIFIYVPVKFRMERWNRLFVDLWIEATTNGNSSTFDIISGIYYNTISENSRIEIPHY